MTTPPIKTLTDEMLSDIENEASMATGGQWEALDSPVGEIYVSGPCNEFICGAIEHVHDANLIVHMSPDNVISLITELRTLRAENAELRKDARRLDWLADISSPAQVMLPSQFVLDNIHSMRDAIDECRKAMERAK